MLSPRIVPGSLRAPLASSGLLGGDRPTFDLALRLGLRIGYAALPRLVIWAEPVTFEAHVLDTDGLVERTNIYPRYAPALGAQYRY